jgi:hypothetical protein
MVRPEPGDFGLFAVVWPCPRTPTAPAICYQQPRCRVVRLSWPYVVVQIAPCRNAGDKAPRYRIHVDNLRRTAPQAAPRVLRPRPRPPLTAGYIEMPLF